VTVKPLPPSPQQAQQRQQLRSAQKAEAAAAAIAAFAPVEAAVAAATAAPAPPRAARGTPPTFRSLVVRDGVGAAAAPMLSASASTPTQLDYRSAPLESLVAAAIAPGAPPPPLPSAPPPVSAPSREPPARPLQLGAGPDLGFEALGALADDLRRAAGFDAPAKEPRV
jgi:hypothetical protein